MILINLDTQLDTIKLAECIATNIFAPLVLSFSGEIGAGKTTLIRAMLRHLGIVSTIKSPTFSLVESYSSAHLQIHHFDLYRIYDESELDYIGFRDYFQKDAICCIEWLERAPSHLKLADLNFKLKFKNLGRTIQIVASSTIGTQFLSTFKLRT